MIKLQRHSTIETIMATTPSKDAKASTVATGSTEAQAAPAEKGQSQIYFVPDYNVSVEATSQADAIAKAKKLKGAK